MQWSEVLGNQQLKDLPFKIELNEFGKILMTPRSNLQGSIQARVAATLLNDMPEGEVITECSIDTSDGVKVADVVWASTNFMTEFGYDTPYKKAPELCVEIVSPSNSKKEMKQKTELYLAKGAQEVWVVYENTNIDIFTHTGKQEQSQFSASLVETILQQLKH